MPNTKFDPSSLGIKSEKTRIERLNKWKEYRSLSLPVLEEFEKTRKELSSYKLLEESQNPKVIELNKKLGELYNKFDSIRAKYQEAEKGITIW
ncbi:MAG: hypothetical protein V1847_03615 [Candidatus Diapherotrites archaeon]